MAEVMEFEVQKDKSGGYPVYLGFATLRQLGSISFPDRYLMDTATPQGFQRALDKGHAREFARYIQTPEGSVPPLLFSLRAQAEFAPRSKNGHSGVLSVPVDGKSIAQLDAQHRLAFTSDLDITVPFVIYEGLSEQDEIRLFTTINDKHKGLTKSLVDSHSARLEPELENSRPHLAIAIRLNQDTQSPWCDAVNMGGESSTPGTKRKVNLRTFQQATEVLISGPQCTNAPDFATKYECALNFWRAVADVFSDAFQNHRKNLITKGVGVHALCEVGRDIIEACLTRGDRSEASMEGYIGKLKGLDWGNKTSPFAMAGGRKGAHYAARALNKVIFGTASVDQIWDILKEVLEEQSEKQ